MNKKAKPRGRTPARDTENEKKMRLYLWRQQIKDIKNQHNANSLQKTAQAVCQKGPADTPYPH